MYIKGVFLSLLIVCLFAIVTINVSAQVTSSEVGQMYEVAESIPSGSVVCLKPPVLSVCDKTYSPNLFGVVTDTPVGAIVTTDTTNNVLVVKGGSTILRVTNSAGNISKGDLLTSSSKPGLAEKATRNGFVIGQALEDFSGNEEGSILVLVNIYQATSFTDARSNLLEILREGVSAAVITPLALFRYILSAFVVFTSFVLGFIYFGRVSSQGVEAIGRNPLASRRIQFNIILNLIFMFGIFLIGLALAYFILTL